MPIEITLEEFPCHTQHVVLAVFGYCLTRTHFLQPVWDTLTWPIKTREHRPFEKLQDVVVNILAGNPCLSHINTRLRPDLALAAAWKRQQFAEQSNIAKMLDDLTPSQITQLREGIQQLFLRHSQTGHHDFDQGWLMVDIDLTGLRASKQAEGSEKGYFSDGRNHYGRQLVRVSIPTYHETLFSRLYPGNQVGNWTVKPTIQAVQTLLSLTPEQRCRTIIRSDAGLGTDENVNWLLWQRYHVLMKGYSGSRAKSLAARLTDDTVWLDASGQGQRWIAWAVAPPRFGRHMNVFLLRWPGKQGYHYATLLSTLEQRPPVQTWNAYDGRGAAEVEIKADKQGLRLPRRRKRSFAAQEALILLTDLAHNLLSWLHHGVLEQTAFADFGAYRIVDELFAIPGTVELKEGKLQKVALLKTHPYADPMRQIVHDLLDFFCNPVIFVQKSPWATLNP